MTGRVHSIQSMGTVDGPGVRYVVFLQGCNLRCACCHNPDTWSTGEGVEYTADEIVSRAERFREYFGREGGVTLSGGEPLLQANFAREVFDRCHKAGINTCLDTSGSLLTDAVKALLDETDRVLLDVKYTTDELYQRYVGCGLKRVLEFLDYLDEKGIATTLRQVVIPGLNDNAENVLRLKAIARAHKCVDKVELLPFRKLCEVKYKAMSIDFPLANVDEPTGEKMNTLRAML